MILKRILKCFLLSWTFMLDRVLKLFFFSADYLVLIFLINSAFSFYGFLAYSYWIVTYIFPCPLTNSDKLLTNIFIWKLPRSQKNGCIQLFFFLNLLNVHLRLIVYSTVMITCILLNFHVKLLYFVQATKKPLRIQVDLKTLI